MLDFRICHYHRSSNEQNIRHGRFELDEDLVSRGGDHGQHRGGGGDGLPTDAHVRQVLQGTCATGGGLSRELPDMMSAKLLDFLTISPVVHIWI